jgi:hypothetical protein
MYPYRDPRMYPDYNRYRGVSPPRNAQEYPRSGYFPSDYGRVSPLPRERELHYPDFSRMQSGPNSHYPHGTERRYGGFWQGGRSGEWQHW